MALPLHPEKVRTLQADGVIEWRREAKRLNFIETLERIEQEIHEAQDFDQLRTSTSQLTTLLRQWASDSHHGLLRT